MFGRDRETLADTSLAPRLPHKAPVGPVPLPLVPLVMITTFLCSSLTPSSSVLHSRPVKCTQNWF